jgi:hypothetical protein
MSIDKNVENESVSKYNSPSPSPSHPHHVLIFRNKWWVIEDHKKIKINH